VIGDGDIGASRLPRQGPAALCAVEELLRYSSLKPRSLPELPPGDDLRGPGPRVQVQCATLAGFFQLGHKNNNNKASPF